MPRNHKEFPESEFSHNIDCPACGSDKRAAVYSDGHVHCHKCEYHTPPANPEEPQMEPREAKPASSKKGKLLSNVEYHALPKRGLTEETCKTWGYGIATIGFDVGKLSAGDAVQVAQYKAPEGGEWIAQKCRNANKDFAFLGANKQAALYGQWRWRDQGKRVVVTEGELDALSVSQVQDHKWPVVSVKDGAGGAHKHMAAHIEWLLGFDEIVLMLDDDSDGRLAVEKCAELFPAGRVKVATIDGHKDANSALVAGEGRKIIDAIWSAKTYAPDGLVTIDDIEAEALKPIDQGYPWFLDCMNELTYGRKLRQLVFLGAGAGVGKTDFVTQQIAHDLTVLKKDVGVFFMEQAPVETLQRLAGKVKGKTFHIPDTGWTADELKDGIKTIKSSSNLHLYKSFGANDWETVSKRIRFLRHTLGYELFYVDNLTSFAACADDEKKALERITSEMATLCHELNIWMLVVSHLATPEGPRGHEEGARVMLKHFKGSRSIGFWGHFAFGLERDTQADDKAEQERTTVRCLKDRFSGRANGETWSVKYDPDTTRISETTHVNSYGFEADAEDAPSDNKDF